MGILMKYSFIITILITYAYGLSEIQVEEEADQTRFTIEGRVFAPDIYAPADWHTSTKIFINGGDYKGFLKSDGSFIISGVPSGSYVLETINPDYMYEPVRVEINSKGKFRARKVNHVQTSQIVQVPYPLKLKTMGRFRYFQVREQWKVTDFLFNPMVLMMVLPLLLIMILPKMMSDPETKKEMENLSSFTKVSEMPEMSEMITSFFSGGQSAQKSKAVKTNKKRQ